MVAPHEAGGKSKEEEDTLTHRIIHRVSVAIVMTVALAVPAVAAAAGGDPLIVPTSSTEHANTDVMVAPASSTEHGAIARSATALIVPTSSTEHANPDVMVAPASSSEHGAIPRSSSALASRRLFGPRSLIATGVIAESGPSTHSEDRWASLAAASLLLTALVATAVAIRLQIRGRDVAVQ